MTHHSPQEWAELIRELRAIRDNPAESRSRRTKARDILDRIERPVGQTATASLLKKEGAQRTTRYEQVATALEYDGTIV